MGNLKVNQNGKLEDAKKMLAEGMDIEIIKKITGLSEEEIVNSEIVK